MKDFIINNNSWLQYLKPFIIFLGFVVIAASAELVYLIIRKQKSRDLKSRRRRSPFAAEYSDYTTMSSVSSSPIARENRGVSVTQKTERRSVIEAAAQKTQHSGSVLEFYFDFEDDFKL